MTSGRPAPRRAASTLVITLFTLTTLSLLAAFTLARVMPRVRMAYQNAAWQEARLAAEAGVDCAMNDLLKNATGFGTGTWQGWKEETPPPGTANAPTGSLLQPVDNLLGGVLQPPLALVGSLLGSLLGQGPPPPSNAVTATKPIYLDNLKVSASVGLPTEVDVRLWGLSPVSSPHLRWFRIRAMATCALPPSAYESPANLDASLRRFSLRAMRNSLRQDDPGKPSTVPFPNVSRTVEVLVEPILPFELALWTSQTARLAPTGSWNIDSFDSSDLTKSSLGLYPGANVTAVQKNGDVGSSFPHPASTLYGPSLFLNGTRISGAIATNGGDNPATPEHENVDGALNVDPSRIHDDFARDMPPLSRPSFSNVQAPPATGAFTPGTSTTPAVYAVPGSLTKLRISSPLRGATGSIVIMIDGDLNLSTPLIVPPTVTAVLFVRGNITFRGNVNSGPWNSNRASQLLIFGDSQAPARQTLTALGEISVCAAFYGPRADLKLEGGVSWMGSLAGGSFEVTTGGDGGIHYDESLATVGPPIGFRISRYVEDVRQ